MVTFNTFNFALTDQKQSASLSVLARPMLVMRRWSNLLGITILSFTSCCNETIRVGEHRGGVSDQFIVPVCISYRQGPHTVSQYHTTTPHHHPIIQLQHPALLSNCRLLSFRVNCCCCCICTDWPCCWMPGMTPLVKEAACLQITDKTRQPS